MAELAIVAKEVRRHWLSQGLQVSPVTQEEFSGLRQLQPDGRWEEYEAFLRIAGLPRGEDREGFRFWLPREVRPFINILADPKPRRSIVYPSVIFADYLQESYWYGLWLDGPCAGSVYLVLDIVEGEAPLPPIGRLVDFLLAYLANDSRMYPPA